MSAHRSTPVNRNELGELSEVTLKRHSVRHATPIDHVSENL